MTVNPGGALSAGSQVPLEEQWRVSYLKINPMWIPSLHTYDSLVEAGYGLLIRLLMDNHQYGWKKDVVFDTCFQLKYSLWSRTRKSVVMLAHFWDTTINDRTTMTFKTTEFGAPSFGVV